MMRGLTRVQAYNTLAVRRYSSRDSSKSYRKSFRYFPKESIVNTNARLRGFSRHPAILLY